jgi:hypothetical protein
MHRDGLDGERYTRRATHKHKARRAHRTGTPDIVAVTHNLVTALRFTRRKILIGAYRNPVGSEMDAQAGTMLILDVIAAKCCFARRVSRKVGRPLGAGAVWGERPRIDRPRRARR